MRNGGGVRGGAVLSSIRREMRRVRPERGGDDRHNLEAHGRSQLGNQCRGRRLAEACHVGSAHRVARIDDNGVFALVEIRR